MSFFTGRDVPFMCDLVTERSPIWRRLPRHASGTEVRTAESSKLPFGGTFQVLPVCRDISNRFATGKEKDLCKQLVRSFQRRAQGYH